MTMQGKKLTDTASQKSGQKLLETKSIFVMA
jgi:hypothetical protein